MAIELIGSGKQQPAWLSACNGVIIFSPNRYFCDGGFMSPMDEMKRSWKNRGRVLLHVEELRKTGQERVSVRDICDALAMTEDFVTFVLQDEFGDELEG